MKKLFLFVPVAALAFAWACGDGSQPVAPAADGIKMAPTATGPSKDDISNNIDASVDAVAEVMPLNVGGASGTTALYLTERNGDGKNGCNLTGGTILSVSASSSNTAVATVSISSNTFTSCGDTKTLTINPVGAGSATISVSETSNTSAGSFNFAPAAFTVNVTAPAPANTAPTITISAVTGGDSYNKGSVPAAACNVTDAEDGNSSFAATLNAITGPYASDGIGSQTASCSYTDGGGLTASSSATYSIVDPSAPSISYVLSPATADGSNGWYKSSVTLTWTVTETESPNSLQKTGCVDQNITGDQAETTYSCSATSAGGSATQVDVKIKRDGTGPSVAYTSATPAANSDGWYNTDVTATFTATDPMSGFAGASTKTGTATTSAEGASVTVGSPTFTDDAGNTAAAGAATSASFKIDKTEPINVAFVGGPASGGSYVFGSVPAAPTCTADDPISGLKSCVVSGYSDLVGPHTLTATATDFAGNFETTARNYTVNAWTLGGFFQPVDMNNVLNTVKAGSTVPLKFTAYAGSSELTDVAIVQSFTQARIGCDATAPQDDIEVTTTGGTSLRYDTTARQFIQNWQTPRTAGVCYRVTLTTDDGSSLVALFKLK